MKTPREILFERHRSAEPKLDALRQKTLDGSRRRQEADFHRGSHARFLASAAAWRELLLSFRWHLAGMSAVWLVIALLNVDPAPAPTRAIARQSTPSPRQFLLALRENRRQLLELIGPSPAETAPAPRTLFPRHRGELQSSNASV